MHRLFMRAKHNAPPDSTTEFIRRAREAIQTEEFRSERRELPYFGLERNATLGSDVCRKGDIGVTGMTERDYYVRRAVEGARAAQQIPCDRDVLLRCCQRRSEYVSTTVSEGKGTTLVQSADPG